MTELATGIPQMLPTQVIDTSTDSRESGSNIGPKPHAG